jgi:hypothetical protein
MVAEHITPESVGAVGEAAKQYDENDKTAENFHTENLPLIGSGGQIAHRSGFA